MDRQNARILHLQNSQGRTALHFACSEGNDLTTDVLLKLGATVEKYVLVDTLTPKSARLVVSFRCARSLVLSYVFDDHYL